MSKSYLKETDVNNEAAGWILHFTLCNCNSTIFYFDFYNSNYAKFFISDIAFPAQFENCSIQSFVPQYAVILLLNALFASCFDSFPALINLAYGSAVQRTNLVGDIILRPIWIFQLLIWKNRKWNQNNMSNFGVSFIPRFGLIATFRWIWDINVEVASECLRQSQSDRWMELP